jgi:hypothetical protein
MYPQPAQGDPAHVVWVVLDLCHFPHEPLNATRLLGQHAATVALKITLQGPDILS